VGQHLQSGSIPESDDNPRSVAHCTPHACSLRESDERSSVETKADRFGNGAQDFQPMGRHCMAGQDALDHQGIVELLDG
jgi:hypothetical protein